MNLNFPPWVVLVVLAGRLFTALVALGAVISKPLENALFSCLSLVAVWFFIEGGINLWHQHQEALERKRLDEERKRQRAEEARLRFESAQRDVQENADSAYMNLDLDDLSVSNAKIPLDNLMTRGAQQIAQDRSAQGGKASRQAAGGMSATEIDMALIEMDTEARTFSAKRAAS